MNVEIISIGDEILIGQIVNTNASWMSRELNLIGASVVQITSVSDNRQHIIDSINDASKRANVIIITGGLGPTKDDITKNTLCEYFSSKLVFSEEAYKDVQRLFYARGLSVTEINRKQAEVPDKCEVLRNIHGTAPGMWFNQNGKIVVSLPGVPYEMKVLMQQEVIPRLQKQFKMPAIIHKTVLTQGIGESFLSELIANWENSLSHHNIKLAYLPSPGMVRLRLSVKGNNKAALEKYVDDKIEELKKLIPQYFSGMEVYGEESKGLEHIVGELLAEQNKTIATAESCTGGYIAHLITSVPGSSKYFLGSVLAYSNEVKNKLLNVSQSDLVKYGAVSKQVVEQMALEAQKILQADYVLATSGIAGPDGGTEEKPVGLIWIALAHDGKVISQKYLFGEDRMRNIRKTALTAFTLLKSELLKNVR